MKTYPEISYDVISTIPIYAFDKIDGSNIRAEWSSKKGFWKFGTRRRLLDTSEPILGEAPKLIKAKYEKDLSKVFYENKWGRVICFFEFWGENSFAGNHEDEEHDVTLIDINPYKKGILSPGRFLNVTEGLDIPKVLWYGRIGTQIIRRIRNSELKGMTHEGVVCKGIQGKQIKMFKIKSRAWIESVKGKFSQNGDKINELLDRTEISLDETVEADYRQRSFCPTCFNSGRLSPLCYKCGASALPMSYDAQPPKKRASKMRWREFFKQNYPTLDFAYLWKNRIR